MRVAVVGRLEVAMVCLPAFELGAAMTEAKRVDEVPDCSIDG